jgi:hypothetical protein
MWVWRYFERANVARKLFKMANHSPLVSSGPREPTKRPRPIPAKVKAAIKLMVRGKDDDPDTKPFGLLEAARSAGMQPFVLRRYLERPTVIALLRSQRRAFRNELCATNESHLADIRANSLNAMAKLGAIRTLEELSDAEYATHRRSEPDSSPHVTIRILAGPAPPPDTPVIDVTPQPQTTTDPWDSTKRLAEPRFRWPPDEPRRGADGYLCDENGRPVFDPDRPHYR